MAMPYVPVATLDSPFKRARPRVCFAAAVALFPLASAGGPCDITWDGDALARSARARSLTSSTRLLDSGKHVVTELTGAQILAIVEAKEGISKQLSRAPRLLFCSDRAPNAFATRTPDGEVVGVTVGLAKLMNGDRDMAAFVIGHEYAHLILGHQAAGAQRRALLTLLGEAAGLFLEFKTQGNTHEQGLGMNVGVMSASLISFKFDRDQERQADQAGFNYMVGAGFSPLGATRLTDVMQREGTGGIGLFFDDHPGWPERTARIQAFIKASPTAQALIARTGASTALASTISGGTPTQAVLAPSYEASNPEKAYADGMDALGKKDFQAGLNALRVSVAAGYAPAQTTLGFLYQEGLAGVSKNEVEAVRLYRLAVAQSNTYAMNDLALMYQQGRGGLQVDDAEALRLYRMAGLQGNPLALRNLGSIYLTGRLGVAQDRRAALDYYQRAAAAGSDDALAEIGMFYQNGWGGIEKDVPKAISLFRQAADKGSASGRYRLAQCYEFGNGAIEKDEIKAVRLFQMAADQGNAAAQTSLGAMYYRGAGGLEKDPAAAARLYRLSADKGDALAQAYLGRMTVVGQGGLPKDPAEGVRLLRRSVDQGSAEGEFILGVLYKFGADGVPRDMPQAVKWLQMAADQGLAAAQANLGSMYFDGEGGLTRSPTEALRLYRLSAAQGNALGQYSLGAMYESGDAGLPRDKETAAEWYRKAAAQGFPGAIKALDELHAGLAGR